MTHSSATPIISVRNLSKSYKIGSPKEKVTIGGNTFIGEKVHIGNNSAISNRINISSNSILKPGTIATRDIMDNAA